MCKSSAQRNTRHPPGMKIVLVLAIIAVPTPFEVTTMGFAERTSAVSSRVTLRMPQEIDTFFGFYIGEERRWTVESETFVLEPGEVVQWTMRLESVDQQSSGKVGHFYLEHEFRMFSRRRNILKPNEMTVSATVTDVWINDRGFPLRVQYRDDRPRMGERRGQVDVGVEGSRLRVVNRMAMAYRDYVLPVPEVEAVDMEVPEGVFLSADLAPGLLTFPFVQARTEWERGTHYVAFDPARLAHPTSVLPERSAASVAPGASAWSVRRPPTPSELAKRSLRRTKLGIGGLEDVVTGGVTSRAYRVDVSTGNDAWIAPDGTVLRVDIMMRRMNAWIRLLRPSEY